MATAAAAAAAVARRRVIEHFMQANATDAKSAIAFVPNSFIERRAFEGYQRRAVLVPVAPDSFYLDLPAYIRDRKAMKKRIAMVMGAFATIGAAVAAIGILS